MHKLKLFLILVFLFLFLFCFSGCSPEHVETDLLLPVDFSNVPENMVLTAFHTDKIEIKIQAAPKLMVLINKENIRYPVDLYTDLEFDPAGASDSIEPGAYLIPVEKKGSYRFDIHSWMQIGANNFNRDDMLFIATDGEKGTTPAKTSIQFPWAGQSVMRSDWESDSWYLFFDAGPTGVNHQNEDKLHIGVSAFGRLFLTDGGISSYVPDKWRRYFTSTQAHNTIIIDGHGQKRMSQKKTHRANVPHKNRWISNERIDFASGIYSDGYGPDLIRVTHSRYVLFKKNEYWLVIDEITGDGEHSFENLFHLTPSEVQIDKEENSVQTLYDDDKNIKLVSSSTVKMNLDIIKGEENPEQGWISLKHDGRIASPTAVYKGSGNLPILIATILQPFTDKNASDIKIELNKPYSSQANLIVHTNKGDDHWIINLQNENNILVNEIEVDGAISFKRENDDKTIENFIVKFKD